jgi:hypothetical protein
MNNEMIINQVGQQLYGDSENAEKQKYQIGSVR